MTTTTPTRARDFGRIFLRGRIYWVRYRVGGKEYVETTRSESPREAERLLNRRQAELGLGVFTAPDVKRTTFDDLAAMIHDDYAVNERRSTERLAASLKHLTRAFAGARALTLTADRLTAYARDRREAGAAPATIRNELNALKRAFKLARRAGKVAGIPEFPRLAAANIRTGFFEHEDFGAVLAELPAALRGPLEFAYLTGWRVPSEILPLTWDRVDFTAGVVRLDVGSTKNREGRTFPFQALPALKALLERQRVENAHRRAMHGAGDSVGISPRRAPHQGLLLCLARRLPPRRGADGGRARGGSAAGALGTCPARLQTDRRPQPRPRRRP